MNSDLDHARKKLQEQEFSCVLCRGSLEYTSTERGVRPLLELINRNQSCRGFAAADKVVGKATAFLYVLLQVKAVHGVIMSRSACRVLQAAGIETSWDTLVDAISNRTQTGPCPMESAVLQIENPREALQAVLEVIRRMQQGRSEPDHGPRS